MDERIVVLAGKTVLKIAGLQVRGLKPNQLEGILAERLACPVRVIGVTGTAIELDCYGLDPAQLRHDEQGLLQAVALADGISVDELSHIARAERALPVDLDGDGRHEFVRGAPNGDGALWDFEGRSLGSVGGAVALIGKLREDRAGEQLLSYREDGTLQLWACQGGADTPEALARYRHRFYAANMRLTASGSNLVNLGGI